MNRWGHSTMRHDIRSDEGFATVIGVVFVIGLVSLLTMMSSVGAWLQAQAQSASVADIAALAAAVHGSCTAAQEAARVNGSQLRECRWKGSDVIVVVSTAARQTPIVLPVMSAEASARAGF